MNNSNGNNKSTSNDKSSGNNSNYRVEALNLDKKMEDRLILKQVSLTASQGQFIGLIGPNGSGKSTLLRIIAGLSLPSSGSLLVNGKPRERYKSRELARTIGYVPQDTAVDFDFIAKDVVLMGRHAHLSRFGSETGHDRLIAQQAMEQTATLHLANQHVTRLSGGQRQMIFIAKALAQQPQLLVMDEPISALDIRYQLHVLHLLKQRAAAGLTVIAALHDLNLAARFCDRLALLADGKLLSTGTPAEVLTEQHIRQAYEVDARVQTDPWLGTVSVTALGGKPADESGYTSSVV